MECESCREALSARLDGESEGHDRGAVDEHLSGCSGCRDWLATATVVTRELRVRPSVDVPDLVGAVMATAPPESARIRRRRFSARFALAGVACVQTALGGAQMLGIHIGMDSPAGHGGHDMMHGTDMTGHLFNESAAWNFALGLALLWAALRPRAVAGLLPMVAVFLAGLSVFVAIDLAKGAVTPTRVLSHLVVVAALGVLLWMRREEHQDNAPTPSRIHDDDAEWPIDATHTSDQPIARTPGRRGRHLRPAGRRAA